MKTKHQVYFPFYFIDKGARNSYLITARIEKGIIVLIKVFSIFLTVSLVIRMMKVLCYKAGERCSVLKDSVSQARVKLLF